MNKIKFFLGAACLVVAFGAAGANKVMTSDVFDYYYDAESLCQPIAETNCVFNQQNPCLIDPDGAGSLPAVQIYESKSGVATCVDPLTRVTP